MKHSKAYIVKYIKTHQEKGHALEKILDHLKTHNCDPDTIYEALKEIQLVEKPAKSMPTKEEVEVTEEEWKLARNTKFWKQLSIYEYVIGIVLLAFIALAAVSTHWVTIFFIVGLLGIGFSYVDGGHTPVALLGASTIIGAVLVYNSDGMNTAIAYGIIALILTLTTLKRV